MSVAGSSTSGHDAKLRTVLDYLPCDACLQEPHPDQELLCSLCRRLDRDVAVKGVERRLFVVKSPAEKAPEVVEIPPAQEPEPVAEPAPAVEEDSTTEPAEETEPEAAAEPAAAEVAEPTLTDAQAEAAEEAPAEPEEPAEAPAVVEAVDATAEAEAPPEEPEVALPDVTVEPVDAPEHPHVVFRMFSLRRRYLSGAIQGTNGQPVREVLLEAVKESPLPSATPPETPMPEEEEPAPAEASAPPTPAGEAEEAGSEKRSEPALLPLLTVTEHRDSEEPELPRALRDYAGRVTQVIVEPVEPAAESHAEAVAPVPVAEEERNDATDEVPGDVAAEADEPAPEETSDAPAVETIETVDGTAEIEPVDEASDEMAPAEAGEAEDEAPEPEAPESGIVEGEDASPAVTEAEAEVADAEVDADAIPKVTPEPEVDEATPEAPAEPEPQEADEADDWDVDEWDITAADDPVDVVAPAPEPAEDTWKPPVAADETPMEAETAEDSAVEADDGDAFDDLDVDVGIAGDDFATPGDEEANDHLWAPPEDDASEAASVDADAPVAVDDAEEEPWPEEAEEDADASDGDPWVRPAPEDVSEPGSTWDVEGLTDEDEILEMETMEDDGDDDEDVPMGLPVDDDDGDDDEEILETDVMEMEVLDADEDEDDVPLAEPVTDDAAVEPDVEPPAEATTPEPDVEAQPEEAAPENDAPETRDVPNTSEPPVDPEEAITRLDGVGEAYGGRLEDAGCRTLGDLVGLDPWDLADRTGISARLVERWIHTAELVKGGTIPMAYADGLVRAGYKGLEAFANADADEAAKALNDALDEVESDAERVDADQVSAWQHRAR